MNNNTSSVFYNGSPARHRILVFSWYPVLKSKFLRNASGRRPCFMEGTDDNRTNALKKECFGKLRPLHHWCFYPFRNEVPETGVWIIGEGESLPFGKVSRARPWPEAHSNKGGVSIWPIPAKKQPAFGFMTDCHKFEPMQQALTSEPTRFGWTWATKIPNPSVDSRPLRRI